MHARTTRQGSRPLLAGLLGGLATSLLSVAAMVAAAASSSTVAGTYALAAAVSAAALARQQKRPGASIAWSAGLLATAPLTMLGASVSLSEPFIASHFRCGTGLVSLLCMAPFVFGGAGAVGATLGAVVIDLRHRVAADVVLRALRVAALLALALLVTLTAGALARSERPVVAEWLDTLPTIGALPPAPALDCAGKTPCQASDELLDVGGHTFARRCTAPGHCELRLATSEAIHRTDGRASEPVRLAARDGLLVVGRSAVFDLNGGGRLTDVDTIRVAGSVAPPRGWLLTALAGLMLALLTAVSGGKRMRLRRRLASARIGRVEDGMILFDDGVHPARAPMLGRPIMDGAVLALPTGPAHCPTYRETGGGPPWRVLPGRRDEVLARHHRLERASFFACMVIALGAAAPCFVAWSNGLLF